MGINKALYDKILDIAFLTVEPRIANPSFKMLAPWQILFKSVMTLPNPEPSWVVMTHTVLPLKSKSLIAVSSSGAYVPQ